MIEVRSSFLDVHGDCDWVGDDEPCEKSRVPGGSVVRHVVLGQSSGSLRCREQSGARLSDHGRGDCVGNQVGAECGHGRSRAGTWQT